MLVMRSAKHKDLTLVSKYATVGDVFHRITATGDLFPGRILDVVSHCRHVYAPQGAFQASVEVLPSQNVEVYSVGTIAHIAATFWHLAFQNDGDPARAHEVGHLGVLRTLQFLSKLH